MRRLFPYILCAKGGILLWFCFFQSCQLSGGENTGLPWSLERLRLGVESRMQLGDSLVWEKGQLQQVLGSGIDPSRKGELRHAAIFLEDLSFSEAEAVYEVPGYKIRLTLSDYAADSSALYHLFQHLEASQSDSISQEIRGPLYFFRSPQGMIERLEGILDYRFHLSIEPDRPLSPNGLQRWYQSLNWSSAETSASRLGFNQ